jgi:hypothetical protein
MFGVGLPEMIIVAAVAITFIFFVMATILMPFFVFRIRNEIISINQKLSVLIELSEKNREPLTSRATPTTDDANDWMTEEERRRIKKFYIDRKREL